MRSSNLILCCFIISFAVTAQIPDRYKAEVFSNWVETQDILFSSGVPQPINDPDFYSVITGFPLNVNEWETEQVDLFMDIFEPEGDTLYERPLIILCFGGGFLSGSRDHWSIRLLCQDLAKRGYVTATIDYRLGMNVYDQDLAMRAVYRGVQDSRSAVRFFKADKAGSNEYKIDTNHIYIGGHSAGAFVGLHNIYLDKEVERPLSTFVWSQDGQEVPDQFPLDSVGDNQAFNGEARAAFSLAGALGYLSLIEADDVSEPVLFHSEDDGTVPYDSGEPFSSIIWLVLGNDLPTVYGSNQISKRADTLDLNHEFNSYTDRGHGVHEDGSSSLYTDIVPGISDWFYNEYLKPNNVNLLGEDQVCNDNLTHFYSVDGITDGYYDWTLVGGSFLYHNPDSNNVSIAWDTSQQVQKISVLPYSVNGAEYDSLSTVVQFHFSGQNDWIGTSGSWTNPSNWSKGHIPNPCENVILPNQDKQRYIDIPASYTGRINFLSVGENIKLQMGEGAQLLVKEQY